MFKVLTSEGFIGVLVVIIPLIWIGIHVTDMLALQGILNLNDINEYMDYAKLISFIILVPIVAFLVLSIHNLTFIKKETEKALHYVSIIMAIVLFCIGLFTFDSDMKELKKDNIIEVYCNKQYILLEEKSQIEYHSFQEQCKSSIINGRNDIGVFAIELTKYLLSKSILNALLPLVFSLMFLSMVLFVDIKKLDKKDYYFLWYLSSSKGWIKGSEKSKKYNIEVSRPSDNIKILKVSLDYDKNSFKENEEFISYYKTEMYYQENGCPVDKEELETYAMYNAEYMLNRFSTAEIIYKDYCDDKLQEVESKFGELPKIISFGLEFNYITYKKY